MKKTRKILSIFCAVTLIFPLSQSFVYADSNSKKASVDRRRKKAPAGHSCRKASAGRGRKRITVKLSRPVESSSPPALAPSPPPDSDISVRVWEGTAAEKIKFLREYILYHFDLQILDGGTYDDTARADGFECHHLISSSYCAHHPDKISKNKAPAVLIPKEIHDLTGSNSRSGRSPQYLAIEECLCEAHGIEEGIIFGLVDLIEALKYYYTEVKPISSSDVVALPQVQAAFSINPAIFKSPEKPKKGNPLLFRVYRPKILAMILTR